MSRRRPTRPSSPPRHRSSSAWSPSSNSASRGTWARSSIPSSTPSGSPSGSPRTRVTWAWPCRASSAACPTTPSMACRPKVSTLSRRSTARTTAATCGATQPSHWPPASPTPSTTTAGVRRSAGSKVAVWSPTCRPTPSAPTTVRSPSSAPPKSRSPTGARRSSAIWASSRWCIARTPTTRPSLAPSRPSAPASTTATRPTPTRRCRPSSSTCLPCRGSPTT